MPAPDLAPYLVEAPEELPALTDLPDPLACLDGSRVAGPVDWPRRRREILALIEHYQYGPLPPAPCNTRAVEINRHAPRELPHALHRQHRVTCGPAASPMVFTLDVLTPKGDGPFPVILRGDGCWRAVSNEIAGDVLARGYALAEFNRCDFAPDNADRSAGLYVSYPDVELAAIAAWAWGFHRCVDVLVALPFIDASKIAVTGHSRGGKAALLAGATDERVALTAPNNSGCGGAGSYKHQGLNSETAGIITTKFPYWFSPRLARFGDKQDRLPFDQHFVKALVAPRALITTEALGDLWANPSGTRLTHEAVKPVFARFGASDRLGIHFREGGHEHNRGDWGVLLDFADGVFFGKAPATPRDFDADPFASASASGARA